MKKDILFFIMLLTLGSQAAFGQNQAKNFDLAVDRKQGKINLDRSNGFGDFIFGTPAKLYKSFKLAPQFGEPTKLYISKTPVNYYGIKIDSVNLDFYKNKLFSITMYIHKSEIQKLISYCLKNYGPKWQDLDDDGSYSWRGKSKKIIFYEVENGQFEVLFIDDTDLTKRLMHSRP